MPNIFQELEIEVIKRRKYFYVRLGWWDEKKKICIYIEDVENLDLDVDEKETAALLAIIESTRKSKNAKDDYYFPSFIEEPQFKESLNRLLRFHSMEEIIEQVYSMKYEDIKEFFMENEENTLGEILI